MGERPVFHEGDHLYEGLTVPIRFRVVASFIVVECVKSLISHDLLKALRPKPFARLIVELSPESSQTGQ